MAESNYVEILVKARDEAKPDLDDLRAKLDELDKKVADARVRVSDEGDAAKLDRFAAKLDDLDHKTASPRIRLAGALRAEAEIHAIEASLDDMERKADDAGAQGVIGKFLNGAGAGSLGGPLKITALAGLFTFLAEQVTSILGPLAAAGLGLGAFGALAVPALDKVRNAYAGITAAQKNYQAAVALSKADPTAANAKAAELALDKLKIAWQGMSPLTRQGVSGIQGIVSEFSGLAQRIAPEVLRIFNDLLPGIHQLIGDMGPFASAVGPVLDKLAKSFSQFTMSAGFKQFLDQMLKISPQAVATIAEGIGKIAIAIGQVLETSAKGNGLKDLGRDFSIIAGTVKVLGLALLYLAKGTESNIGMVIRWVKDLVEAGKNLYRWWMDAWNFMARLMQGAQANISGQIQIVIGWIKTASGFVARVFGSDIPHWIGVAVAWFSSLPGKVLHAVGDFGSLLYSAGQALLQGLLGGIESMVGSVVSAAESVGSSILGAIKHRLGIGSPSKEGIAIGANFGDSVVTGMMSRFGKISDAASRMGRMVIPAGGAHGYGHAGGGLHLVVSAEGVSDPLVRELVRVLRFEVRTVGGGNPDSAQRFWGRTA